MPRCDMPSVSVNMGDQSDFLREMLRAYQHAPAAGRNRCMNCAKHFRERGENHSSLLFSEAGMQLPYPASDSLVRQSLDLQRRV